MSGTGNSRARLIPGFDAASWPGGPGIYRSVPWITAMASRIGDRPLTMCASDTAGNSAAMLCFSNDDPDAYGPYNLGALLLRIPPVFDWSEAGQAELRAIRVSAGDVGEVALFPNLTAVLPGYQDSVAWRGPGGAELAAGLLREFTEHARAEGYAAAALLYVSGSARPLTSVLAGLGYHRIALTARATLRLDQAGAQAGLDGYLDALTPHRRRRIRSELRALRSEGISSRLADPQASRELILRLRVEHLTKLGERADVSAERNRLHLLLTRFAAKDLRLVITERAGRVVGCCLLIRAGRTLHCMLSATSAQAPPLTHFETTFYAPITLATDVDVEHIDYGIGHLRGKALRGCELHALHGWARAFDPNLDDLVGRAARLGLEYNIEAQSQ
jgi:hypothetical protein